MDRAHVMQVLAGLKGNVFYIGSRATGNPLVHNGENGTSDDTVDMFITKEAAEAAAADYDAKGYKCTVVTLSKQIIPAFYGKLFALDVECLRVVTNNQTFRFPPQEFVRRQVKEGAQAPVENPALAMSLLYYKQDFMCRHEKGSVDDETIREDYEEVMLALRGSRLLMPVIEEEGKNAFKFVLMQPKTADGKVGTPMIPMFTDGIELAAMKRPAEWAVKIVPFEGLLKMQLPKNCGGIVLNPAGASVPLLAEALRSISAAMASEAVQEADPDETEE